MGFLSKLDSGLGIGGISELDPNTSDTGKAAVVLDPLNIPATSFLAGNIGPFGTPTEKAVETSPVPEVTGLAHNRGAEIAASIAGGPWVGLGLGAVDALTADKPATTARAPASARGAGDFSLLTSGLRSLGLMAPAAVGGSGAGSSLAASGAGSRIGATQRRWLVGGLALGVVGLVFSFAHAHHSGHA